jgi:hypothetical protein
MGLRKRIKNSNRGAIPNSVSPYPEKLPYGLLPWSYTFDFTSGPSDITTGGDDWLYNRDTTPEAYFENDFMNVEYNQTVEGVDGCVKYTIKSGQLENIDNQQLYAYDPLYFPSGVVGRINSFPSDTELYSKSTITAKVYVSDVNPDSFTEKIELRIGNPGYRKSNNQSIGEAIQVGQWQTVTGELDHSTRTTHQPLFYMLLDGDPGSSLDRVRFFNTEDDFLAISYITITMTP